MSRRFVPGIPNHCYQKTIDGSVLFYSDTDYLVCFTHMCTSAISNNVKIMAVSLMPDHIHSNVSAPAIGNLNNYVKEYSSPFAKEQNIICGGRKGPIFKKSYGSAPKHGDKAVRTNIIYIGNNPVERRLCGRAEEYKWNFLPYAVSSHPFSEPIILNKASWNLRNAILEVKSLRKKLLPLKHAFLDRLLSKLNDREKAQLEDYIISIYNVIDYSAAIKYFGSYWAMIEAMHVSTGSEYDIKEEFTGWSDAWYDKMAALCRNQCRTDDIYAIFRLPDLEKQKLFSYLMTNTGATEKQIRKYLRYFVSVSH